MDETISAEGLFRWSGFYAWDGIPIAPLQGAVGDEGILYSIAIAPLRGAGTLLVIITKLSL
jgi:hypothetical protein